MSTKIFLSATANNSSMSTIVTVEDIASPDLLLELIDHVIQEFTKAGKTNLTSANVQIVNISVLATTSSWQSSEILPTKIGKYLIKYETPEVYLFNYFSAWPEYCTEWHEIPA
jgi:hypothetical protein